MTRPPNDRGQGRKPMPEDQKTIVRSVRLTAAEWAKFQALGAAEWLRAMIKRAKIKGLG